MTQPHMLLIYNSRAGKGSFLTRLPEVIDMFVKGGYRVEVYPTQAAGDAVEKVSQRGRDRSSEERTGRAARIYTGRIDE